MRKLQRAAAAAALAAGLGVAAAANAATAAPGHRTQAATALRSGAGSVRVGGQERGCLVRLSPGSGSGVGE